MTVSPGSLLYKSEKALVINSLLNKISLILEIINTKWRIVLVVFMDNWFVDDTFSFEMLNRAIILRIIFSCLRLNKTRILFIFHLIVLSSSYDFP